MKDHPELAPFFRMVRMGVPMQAVKLKARLLSSFQPWLLDSRRCRWGWSRMTVSSSKRQTRPCLRGTRSSMVTRGL